MSQEAIQPTMTQAGEPSSLRLIATLGVAGFLSGLILVGMYILTRPTIAANKAEAQRQAIFKVLPGTTSFRPMKLSNGTLIEADAPTGDVIFLGLDDQGGMTGFAISDKEAGFQDLIGVIYGYRPAEKSIIGYEVLDCKETPGLGDKIFKDEAFIANFQALVVDPEIILVKRGEKSKPNQVDAITGATISSRTVVKLLNRTMNQWKGPIDAYWQANANGHKPVNQ